MITLDLPTAYLVVGALFLLVPASGWLVLSPMPSRVVALWCGGGLVFGVGLILIGGRPSLPDWLAYPVASGLTILGLCMKAGALALQQGRPWSVLWLALLVSLYVLVFEALHASDRMVGTLVWGSTCIMLCSALVSRLAFRLHRLEASRSARWLGMVYLVGVAHFGLRGLAILLGWIPPEGAAPAWASLITVGTGLVLSIVGTMGFVGMFLDQARRQELEALAERVRRDEVERLGGQVARMQRLHSLNELSGSLAHELNQPLTAILTNAQLARIMAGRQQKSEPQLRALIDDIERDTQRASQVLRRIRDFVRPGSGLREPVVLQHVVQEVLAVLASEFRRAGLEVRTDVPASPVVVHGDSVQLAQVLINLLLNAIQASDTPAARDIGLKLEVSDGRCALMVRDWGNGIAPEHLTQVGTALFTTKEGGTGLGLSIVRGLIEQHGGQLSLCNAPGGGALATVLLPCADAPPPAGTMAESLGSSRSSA